MRPSADGVRLCRMRRSAVGAWPPVFAETFVTSADATGVRRLATELERSGFFGLPSSIGRDAEADPVVLRVEQYGRVHQVVARGGAAPGLARALRAVHAFLPVDPGPLPAWVDGLDSGAAGDRPRLVPDLDAALRFHEAWLADEPERRSLHLDLFALHLRAGDRAAAARQLDPMRADRDLIGLVPELRALLDSK